MLVFALTIFLSAFLLFQIQPLIGKAILPWFGGAPAVWTTCMLFFQLLLLGGYAYAHSVASRLSPRAQRRLHVALLLVAVAGLVAGVVLAGSPVLPPAGLKPSDPSHPVLRILAVLSLAVGLPYFLLATTGPLLQAWFARVHPGASPYRLFALSNVGSLLGLATYPFAVEPRLTLHNQGSVWAAGFTVFAACCVLCAGRFAASGEPADASPAGGAVAPEEEVPPSARQRLLWFALAACASAMLLGATNQICQEVASFPFLWVLPLSLYLLSFIFCFEREGFYRRGVFGPLLAAGVGMAALVLSQGFLVSLPKQVAAHTFALFAVCMVCHGELARAKPGPRHLTAFYLMISAGGAAGGLLVAVVAPRVFNGFWEYHTTLWVAGLLCVVVLALDPASWLRAGRPWPALATLVGALAVAMRVRRGDLFATVVSFLSHDAAKSVGRAALLAGILVLVAAGLWATRAVWWQRGRPYFAAACLVLALALVGTVLLADVEEFRRDAVLLKRNFYGVLTVEEDNKEFPEMHLLKLRNGRIVHGFQYQAPDKRDEPTSYYSPKSGVGLAILKHPHRDLGLRIGVVGLGVGTVASFARLGDRVRFYDINPQVVELSLGEHRVFTYLADCMGTVEVVQGDARLSLERELSERRPQGFDVLVLDAFSSDSIPVHLLTREAVAVYIAHLARPDGILAIHISNRYLELKPVVRGLADAFGCDASLVDVSDSGQYWGSTWVLLAPRGDVLARSGIDDDAEDLEADKTVRLWTDDYSNLFQVVKR
jgi:hypothetical protein